MGFIKNRTTLNNELVSLYVANEAVGKLASKNNSFEKKFENEMVR